VKIAIAKAATALFEPKKALLSSWSQLRRPVARTHDGRSARIICYHPVSACILGDRHGHLQVLLGINPRHVGVKMSQGYLGGFNTMNLSHLSGAVVMPELVRTPMREDEPFLLRFLQPVVYRSPVGIRIVSLTFGCFGFRSR
jgi:hypothetical protein